MGGDQSFKVPFRTNRLLFRAAAEDCQDDITFLHQHIFSDPTVQVMGYTRDPRPPPRKVAEDFVKTLQGAKLGVMICLAPSDLSEEQGEHEKAPSRPAEAVNPQPIGFLSIYNSGEEANHNRSAAVGIAIAEKFRRKGYGSEATNWALDWAFQAAGLHRLSLSVFAYNSDALKLYRKLGFVEEGREREAFYRFRSWYDIANMSILEHEWEELRGITPLTKS